MYNFLLKIAKKNRLSDEPVLNYYALTVNFSFSLIPLVLTVIVVFPAFFAFILPFEVTVAIFFFPEVNFGVPALPVIFIVKVLPTFRVFLVLLSFGFLTLTL